MSLFYHEGGVRYQSDYFLHIGTSVFLIVLLNLFCYCRSGEEAWL